MFVVMFAWIFFAPHFARVPLAGPEGLFGNVRIHACIRVHSKKKMFDAGPCGLSRVHAEFWSGLD